MNIKRNILGNNIYLLLIFSIILSFLSSTKFQFSQIASILAIFILLIYITVQFLDKGFDRNKVLVSYFVVIWILISVLVNFISSNGSLDGTGNLIGSIVIVFILSINHIEELDEKDIINITLFMKVLGLLVITTSILDIFNIISIGAIENSKGYSWYFINTNSFGSFLLFIFLYLLYFMKDNLFKFILLFSLIFLSIASLSRVVLLISLLNLVVYIFFSLKLKQRLYILILYILSGLFILNLPEVIKYIEVIKIKNEGITSGRSEIWRYTLSNYIFNSPLNALFGNGFGFGGLSEFDGKGVHNSFLTAIGKYGVIYLFMFILLLMKNLKLNKVTDFVLFVSILVYAFVESSYFTGLNGGWISMVFIIVLNNVYKRKVVKIE